MVEIPMPEHVTTPKPEFDGGSFVISHFSTAPEGFQVQTRSALRRTAGNASNKLTSEQRAQLKGAMKGEMAFNGARAIIEAEKPLRAAQKALKDAQSADHVDDSEVAELRARVGELQAQHKDTIREFRQSPQFDSYRKKMPGKLGLRNLAVEGNTLIADAKFVAFPLYQGFANPELPAALLDLSSVAGTAMIVKSADGRFVIQHRAVAKQRLHEQGLSRGNASYNDQPGASVAGLLDSSSESLVREPGTPDAVDTDSIKGNIFKEAGEELGLNPDDMQTLRIVGIAEDKVKVHNEVLLLGDTKLTAEQIEARSRISNRNKNLGEADFEEKFISIPATPQAVETLLTDVKCPMPPTHYAAMVAAGYSLVLQERGLDAAEAWKKELEGKMQENARAMNRMVTDYYDMHPEALAQVPERYWTKGQKAPGRNPRGYTPEYTPEEQGLPNFEDEMTRTGLIPETRRHVDTAWMFDVDGPITDPLEKGVKHEELIDKLADRLAAGEPVFLNTGRTTTWVEKKVIPKVREKIDDPALMEHLVIVGEKGGTWTTYDHDGNAQHGRVQALAIPDGLYAEVDKLVQTNYGDSMSIVESGFTERTKQTMISLEMRDGYDLNEFQRQRARLVPELHQLLEDQDLAGKYKVDSTTIATDIESPFVGKALGADRCMEYLRDKGIKPAKFIAFGDSPSDLEMADELDRRGQKVEFVYVGDPAKLSEQHKGYEIHKVGGYTQGTLEYLNR